MTLWCNKNTDAVLMMLLTFIKEEVQTVVVLFKHKMQGELP